MDFYWSPVKEKNRTVYGAELLRLLQKRFVGDPIHLTQDHVWYLLGLVDCGIAGA